MFLKVVANPNENTATATDGEQRNAEGEQRNAEGDQNGKDDDEDGDINSKSVGGDTTEGVDGGEIVVTDSQGDAETTSVGKRKRDEAEDDAETSAGKKKVCEMLNTTVSNSCLELFPKCYGALSTLKMCKISAESAHFYNPLFQRP